jgi:hypothetical protein
MRSNRLLSIALLFCFVIPIILKVGILSNYAVQYKYYVDVLCENKNKPELQCKGKCCLAKELNTVEEEPLRPEIPQSFKGKSEKIFFIEDFSNLVSSELTEKVNSYSNYHPIILSFYFKGEIFQPPDPIGQICI